MIAALALTVLLAGQAPALAQATVGMEERVSFVSDHGDLRVREQDAASEVLLRIADVAAVGERWRYDLRFVGMVPGDFDLAARLERVDGAAASSSGIGPLPVHVEGLLPEDHDGALSEAIRARKARLARLAPWLAGLAALWLAPLVYVFFTRRRRVAPRAEPALLEEAPRTLADQLRELIGEAREGALSREAGAQLERLMIAAWRERLGARDLAPADAIARLRADPEAGRGYGTLERWLHAAADRSPSQAEIDAALAPFAALPALSAEQLGPAEGAPR